MAEDLLSIDILGLGASGECDGVMLSAMNTVTRDTSRSPLPWLTVDLPKSAEDITAKWITAALRASGADVDVVATETTPIGLERGFASQLFRVVLHHADASSPFPSVLVAKLPPRGEAERAANAALWLDRREVEFYREFAPETPVRTPRCYFARLESEEGSGVLLLEDVGHAETVEPLASCEPERAVRVVEAAARGHAHFWEDPRLPTRDWLSARLDETHAAVAKLIEGLWPAFTEYAGDRMPASVASRPDDIAAAYARLPDRIRSGGSTLCHGDFWFGNLLFEQTGLGDEQVLVLDWAMVSWGLGTADLAIFLGASLPTPMRREVESQLLDHYHAGLVRCGVRVYSMAALLADYRLSLLAALSMPVLESGGRLASESRRAEPAPEQPADAVLEAIADANTSRLLAAIEDNDALSVLA